MTIRIFHRDCLDYLKAQPEKSYDCVFADPPDNLGLGYDDYDDTLPPSQYYAWLFDVVREMARVSRGTVWLSFYAKHLRPILRWQVPMGYTDRLFIWTYTFSQYRDTDFANSYRPILQFARQGWKPSVDLIRVPSRRMELGDKRAAGPRCPSDVWEFPRVVGNAKERRPHHPTQHPEALMERVLLASKPKDGPYRVLDVFGGTFTTARVSMRLGIDCDSCEMSLGYCEHGARDLGCEVVR